MQHLDFLFAFLYLWYKMCLLKCFYSVIVMETSTGAMREATTYILFVNFSKMK